MIPERHRTEGPTDYAYRCQDERAARQRVTAHGDITESPIGRAVLGGQTYYVAAGAYFGPVFDYESARVSHKRARVWVSEVVQKLLGEVA